MSHITCWRASGTHLLQDETYSVLADHGDVSLQLLNLCMSFSKLGLQLCILQRICITSLLSEVMVSLRSLLALLRLTATPQHFTAYFIISVNFTPRVSASNGLTITSVLYSPKR